MEGPKEPYHESKQIQPGRPTSPAAVSCGSDRSKEGPPNFNEGSIPTSQSSDLSTQKQSSVVKSTQTNYRFESVPPGRPTSPAYSSASDRSMGNPPAFKDIAIPTSDWSTEKQSSIIKSFEEQYITFTKKALSRFTRILCPNNHEEERPFASDTHGEERHAEEAAMTIALHVLREMNHSELADTLEKGVLGELATCQNKLKRNLKRKSQYLFDGIAEQGNHTLLNDIYTDLQMIEGGPGDVNDEHEVRQIESKKRRPESAIKSSDIFLPLKGRTERVRNVLTVGIAGIGKTVCVQKFTLDWIEGTANQKVHLIFPLSFRQLNLVKDRQFSFLELLQHFFVEVKESGIEDFDKYTIVIILDGLDESRLTLNFEGSKTCKDIRESASLDVLITSLIEGNLLPSAGVWITSRPAAANQIPPKYVDQLTEVRGFNDPQKEEYFVKRICNKTLAVKISKHMKTSRSFHIMCHIPFFCWISATVLENILYETMTRQTKALSAAQSDALTQTEGTPMTVQSQKEMASTKDEGPTGKGSKMTCMYKEVNQVTEEDMPTTLTQMYTHFLSFQLNRMKDRYEYQQDWEEVVLSLGKLAYQQLERGHLIFYEQDLLECGIDIKTASVYSGICTQIFIEENLLHREKMYCFVHLSIQEFLASVYVLLVFLFYGVNLIEGEEATMPAIPVEHRPLTMLHKSAVDKALQSKNGHLDLFLRFLLGFSLETPQSLLQALLTRHWTMEESNDETVKYVKEKIKENPSPERCVNLFYCLMELNDHSLVEEIQNYLSSESDRLSKKDLSPAQWSALAFVLLSSEAELEVFDLKKYSRSEEGLLRLRPVVKASSTALLNGCNLSERSYKAIATTLCSKSSLLRKLDLSDNGLNLSGIANLAVGLGSQVCKLESLRLNRCTLDERCCERLALVLSSNSSLRELDLSDNDLQDLGVKLLCGGLEKRQCMLETLKLSFCGITKEGCSYLVSAIESNPSHLKELDLSYNNLGEAGKRLLTAVKENPLNEVEKLSIDHDAECWLKSGLKAYAFHLTLDPNTVHRELTLSEDSRTVFKRELQVYPDHPERFESCGQVLCQQSMTGRYYWEVEWSRSAGDLAAYVGVAYKRIKRKGGEFQSLLGRNDDSWSIRCASDNYMAWHSRKNTIIPVPSVYSNRLGLYLDWPNGTLSFYSVSSQTLTHLHTFEAEFTEPLYAAFRLWADDSSVSLCDVENNSRDRNT